MNYSMNNEELRNFCIEHNLPFTVEFDKPWYPKPIEVSLSKSKENIILTIQKGSEQAIIDSLIYGTCRFLIVNNENE